MARIKGITIELDGETRGLDKALSNVNKRTRDVQKELRQVDRLLRFNPKNTELLTQRKKLLSEQVKNTSDRLKALKQAEKEVQQQFKEGKISEKQYREFRREIVETESKLKHYKRQLREVQNVAERFGESMQKAGQKVKEVGQKISDVGKTMTTRVTTPILGAAAAATKIGSDFEASMSKVAATSGASADELEKLTEKAREMGATTMFSASESAEALNYMALAGWEVEEMLDGIDGVMALAAASGEDLALVSDIVTDGLSAFGMQAQESGRMADVLAAASANANTDVNMLGQAFSYVAPVAGSLGFTIEDTAKAIGLMSNAGIKSTKAGTALRAMMTNLAKPTAAMQEAMEELGISLTDSEGNMKSFDEIMRDLRASFSGLTEEQKASTAATLFGKEAMSGALAIINASEEDYNKLTDAIQNSEGAAEEMADTVQDNLQGRLKEMKSVLEDVAITVYDNIQPALESLIALVTKAAQWFGNLSPEIQTTIIVIAGLVAAIGPLLIVIGAMAKGLGTVITVVGTVISVVGKLGGALAALVSPVGLVIAAIAGLIAIGVALWKNWDTVSKYANEIWGGISNFFSGTMSKIGSAASSAWSSVSDNFKNMSTSVKAGMSGVRTAIVSGWSRSLKYLKSINLFSVGKDIINGLIKGIASMASALAKKMKDVVGGAISGAKKLLGIASPSRVFMGIGEDTAKGLAIGLNSMGDRVERASQEMTTNVITGSDLAAPVNESNKSIKELIELIASKDQEIVINVEGAELARVIAPLLSRELDSLNRQEIRNKGVVVL